ncbi:uncharacterized protein LOC121400642 [Xenopus laevis]|uniref:Uncharacterized protein LOC121400642 n=1 Tax=Xenopus laevis TaxID=8355 RepID=A0A8J1MEZ2_XENLA|nr:uncharacterized protein LOC121400642 [Xenopus laevis]
MMTTNRSSENCHTFAYTESEIQRILTEAELNLEEQKELCFIKDPAKDLFNLQRKEVSLLLHQSTLIRYVKAKQIPRGLRLDITPNLCTDDPILMQRWHEITNKCSLDLMVLMIERAHCKLTDLKQQINLQKADLTTKVGIEETERLMKRHNESLDKLRQTILARKVTKFTRDEEDYAKERVYTWRQDRTRQRSEGGPQRIGLSGQRRPRTSWRERRNPAVYTSSEEEVCSGVQQYPFLGARTEGGDVVRPKQRTNSRTPIDRDHYPRRDRQPPRLIPLDARYIHTRGLRHSLHNHCWAERRFPYILLVCIVSAL